MKEATAGNESHLDRNLNLQEVNAVAVVAEFLNRSDDNFRLDASVFQTLLMALQIVAEELEDERNVVGAALVSNTLSESAFHVVDFGRIERRVVQEHLDAVGAGFLHTAHRPAIVENRQARGRSVVTGLLIGKQQACSISVLRRWESIFWIKQNGRCMDGQS